MSNSAYPSPGQPPAGQAWGAPPPPPKKGPGAGKIIGLGCAGVVGLFVVLGVVGALAGSGASDDTAAPEPAATSSPAAAEATKEAEVEDGPEGDVEITACEVEDFTGWPQAKVTVTNRSSKTSDYFVSVEFLDAGGTRHGEGTAAVNNLAPGQAAKETAQGVSEVPGEVSCRVADVTRYASP